MQKKLDRFNSRFPFDENTQNLSLMKVITGGLLKIIINSCVIIVHRIGQQTVQGSSSILTSLFLTFQEGII